MNKKEGSGLGFSVAGGTDVEPKSIVVSDNVEMLSEESLLKQPQNLIRTEFMSVGSKNAGVCSLPPKQTEKWGK